MSTLGPFDTRVGVMQRSTNLIDLVVRNRMGTGMYRLYGADNIDDLYGTVTDSGIAGSGGTVILTAQAGQWAKSVTPRGKNWPLEEVRRGQTTFWVDPDDYAPNLPEDDHQMYFRVQEFRAGQWAAVPDDAVANAGYPKMGPITVVPPARYYGSRSGSLVVSGTAPADTTCSEGSKPVFDETVQKPIPLHLTFPMVVSGCRIENLSDTQDLLYTFDPGSPMSTLASGEAIRVYDEGVRQMILAAASDIECGFNIRIQTTQK